MEECLRISANDTEPVCLSSATIQELLAEGYVPTSDAGSTEIIWRQR